MAFPTGTKPSARASRSPKSVPLSPSDFISFCSPSDYCLTTIFPKPEKPREPRRTKGFRGFRKWVLILCDVPETRMETVFLL